MTLAAWRNAAIAVAVEGVILLAGVLAGHAAARSSGSFAFDWDVAVVTWAAAASLVVWRLERAVSPARRLDAPARRR